MPKIKGEIQGAQEQFVRLSNADANTGANIRTKMKGLQTMLQRRIRLHLSGDILHPRSGRTPQVDQRASIEEGLLEDFRSGRNERGLCPDPRIRRRHPAEERSQPDHSARGGADGGRGCALYCASDTDTQSAHAVGSDLMTGTYTGCTTGVGSGCAKGDFSWGSDATTNNGSTMLTTPTGNFTSADIGKSRVAVQWGQPLTRMGRLGRVMDVGRHIVQLYGVGSE